MQTKVTEWVLQFHCAPCIFVGASYVGIKACPLYKSMYIYNYVPMRLYTYVHIILLTCESRLARR